MAEAPPAPIALFTGPDSPAEEDLYKCVHCGFCLQACPTYLQTGLETESPRGRIALMKAVNEGRLGISPTVVSHWDLCIQCRACEVACPSGVPYGRLIEATMTEVERHRKPGIMARAISGLLLKHVLPKQGRLTLLANGLRLYQRTGLQTLVRKARLLNLLSTRMAELERSSPTVPGSFFRAYGQVIPPVGRKKAVGEKRARVALLSGCIMPLVHGPDMDAMTRVLARNGCEVVVTRDQVCCGAINSHVGDLETARELARRNIDAFLANDVDAIVNASAGCGTRLKEYDHLLEGDQDYAEKAKTFSRKVRDIHEFLVELPLIPPTGRIDRRVTYQDSCHLAHSQRITEAPRKLLRSVPGLELVEMEGSTQCCGAGGTYTITQREMSLQLLDSKMQAAGDTGADIIATANPGCVIQLQYGAHRTFATTEVRYVTELLDEAYRAEPLPHPLSAGEGVEP